MKIPLIFLQGGDTKDESKDYGISGEEGNWNITKKACGKKKTTKKMRVGKTLNRSQSKELILSILVCWNMLYVKLPIYH